MHTPFVPHYPNERKTADGMHEKSESHNRPDLWITGSARGRVSRTGRPEGITDPGRALGRLKTKKARFVMKRNDLKIAAVVALALFTGIRAFAAPASVDSATLKKNVEKAYTKYYDEPIDVTVPQPGTVLLKGDAETFWDKSTIFGIVSRVKGVNRIINNLTVKTDPVPDGILKTDVENQIRSNRTITEPGRILVSANNGLVILSGTVNFYHEAVVAEQVAGWLKGVISVDNQLEVLPPARAETDEHLSGVVGDVLKENFPLEAANVHFAVDRRVLTLSGTVGSLWLKHAIEDDLHGIVGLKEVVNGLAVEPYMP
jgi:osmotically-inducible protein OsmY